MENTSRSETDSIPDFERRCEACRGDGSYRGRDGRVRCGICNGSGWVPTEWGEKVLALMRHNFRPLLEDAAGGEEG
jgi:DnaJ-class molecular chaperone